MSGAKALARETDDELLARAGAWAKGDPDPTTRSELEALIDREDMSELRERMLGEIEFGTAGLRGLVAAGSARMNLAVVIRVTRALANHLLKRVPDVRARPVVIGGDARHDSPRFADAAARVLLAAGFRVKRFREPVPTPLLSYAVPALSACAGVMITASHNGREYNGYKLYAERGVQVVAPDDREIAEGRRDLPPADAIPLGDLASQDGIPRPLGEAYLSALLANMPATVGDRSLRIVYTPLHGVGAAWVERLLAKAGYERVHSVVEQREPDAEFPTTPLPNPEQSGALDLAIARAEAARADVLLANDPDADRLAVALPTQGGRFVPLTGNQVGILLADFALRHTALASRALVLTSLVSSPMLESIAAEYGARCERVLTGFKWIWTAALALAEHGYEFCLGYEEAIGYAFGRVAHDKDGVGAALAFAELSAEARAAGRTPWDILHALYRRHGLWVSVQHNLTLEGSAGTARIAQALERAVSNPPHRLGPHPIEAVRDYRVAEPDAPAWRDPARGIPICPRARLRTTERYRAEGENLRRLALRHGRGRNATGGRGPRARDRQRHRARPHDPARALVTCAFDFGAPRYDVAR